MPPYLLDDDEIVSLRRYEEDLEKFGEDSPRLSEDGSITMGKDILIRRY